MRKINCTNSCDQRYYPTICILIDKLLTQIFNNATETIHWISLLNGTVEVNYCSQLLVEYMLLKTMPRPYTACRHTKYTHIIPYSGKLSWDKTFVFLVNFLFHGENFRGVYMWSRGAIYINIAMNHEDCRRKESYSIYTNDRGCHVYKDVWEAALGQLLPCQREPGNIHDPRIDNREDRLQ